MGSRGEDVDKAGGGVAVGGDEEGCGRIRETEMRVCCVGVDWFWRDDARVG